VNSFKHNTRLVNEIEAAHTLGLCVKTLRRWRWERKGPAFCKLGSAVRYDPADLRAFIEASRRESTSELRRAA
jgi:predicted DNA-binding transcriptional regulator AlpA